MFYPTMKNYDEFRVNEISNPAFRMLSNLQQPSIHHAPPPTIDYQLQNQKNTIYPMMPFDNVANEISLPIYSTNSATTTTTTAVVATSNPAPKKIKQEKNANKDEVVKQFRCEQCPKVFPRHSSFWKHVKTHSGEKPFQCQICEKRFTQLSNMQRHTLIHTGERPFKCVVCEKAFTQASNLAKHKLLHTGEKPFKCKECNKAFTQRANLKKHELIHSGIKPFLCHLCLKPQSQLANLKKHLAAHEKNKTIKPKICDICKKIFGNNAEYKLHVKKCTNATNSLSSNTNGTSGQNDQQLQGNGQHLSNVITIDSGAGKNSDVQQVLIVPKIEEQHDLQAYLRKTFLPNHHQFTPQGLVDPLVIKYEEKAPSSSIEEQRETQIEYLKKTFFPINDTQHLLSSASVSVINGNGHHSQQIIKNENGVSDNSILSKLSSSSINNPVVEHHLDLRRKAFMSNSGSSHSHHHLALTVNASQHSPQQLEPKVNGNSNHVAPAKTPDEQVQHYHQQQQQQLQAHHHDLQLHYLKKAFIPSSSTTTTTTTSNHLPLLGVNHLLNSNDLSKNDMNKSVNGGADHQAHQQSQQQNQQQHIQQLQNHHDLQYLKQKYLCNNLINPTNLITTSSASSSLHQVNKLIDMNNVLKVPSSVASTAPSNADDQQQQQQQNQHQHGVVSSGGHDQKTSIYGSNNQQNDIQSYLKKTFNYM